MLNETLAGTDLDFLKGATLIQVAIGENEVILHTHPESTILIQSNVVVTLPDGTTQVWETAVEVGKSLLPLLGKTISQALGTPEESLAMTWSDGTTTEILNSWDQYESYSVSHEGQFFVV